MTNVTHKENNNGENGKAKNATRRRGYFLIPVAVVSTIFAAMFAYSLISRQMDVSEFKREQESLAEIKPFQCDRFTADDAEAFKCEQESLNAIASVRELREINPDYVGWLYINGTNIDYPVVRGADNDKYLNTTFRGSTNELGTLFIDYRADDDSPHIIIYGHDVVHWIDGFLMFGGLKHYIMNDNYLERHPKITWLKSDTLFEYEIFSARLTDIHDQAYFLDFSAPNAYQEFLSRNNAPQDARRIMTLSTCVGHHVDKRMIVQAALKQALPTRTNRSDDGV